MAAAGIGPDSKVKQPTPINMSLRIEVLLVRVPRFDVDFPYVQPSLGHDRHKRRR
jgi:hypothetical protein